MNENTVVLNINVYNELRDFKIGIEKELVLRTYGCSIWDSVTFLTKDDAIEKAVMSETKKMNVQYTNLKRNLLN